MRNQVLYQAQNEKLGHELGCSGVCQEQIQVWVTKLGEISDHLREKLLEELRIHLLRNSGFLEKGFTTAYTHKRVARTN